MSTYKIKVRLENEQVCSHVITSNYFGSFMNWNVTTAKRLALFKNGQK